jgi:hypothetical protein
MDVSNYHCSQQGKGTGGRGRAYINRYEDIQPIMLGPHFRVIIVLLCCVMADHERIFGQFLEEAFGCCAVDVEV